MQVFIFTSISILIIVLKVFCFFLLLKSYIHSSLCRFSFSLLLQSYFNSFLYMQVFLFSSSLILFQFLSIYAGVPILFFFNPISILLYAGFPFLFFFNPISIPLYICRFSYSLPFFCLFNHFRAVFLFTSSQMNISVFCTHLCCMSS